MELFYLLLTFLVMSVLLRVILGGMVIPGINSNKEYITNLCFSTIYKDGSNRILLLGFWISSSGELKYNLYKLK